MIIKRHLLRALYILVALVVYCVLLVDGRFSAFFIICKWLAKLNVTLELLDFGLCLISLSIRQIGVTLYRCHHIWVPLHWFSRLHNILRRVAIIRSKLIMLFKLKSAVQTLSQSFIPHIKFLFLQSFISNSALLIFMIMPLLHFKYFLHILNVSLNFFISKDLFCSSSPLIHLFFLFFSPLFLNHHRKFVLLVVLFDFIIKLLLFILFLIFKSSHFISFPPSFFISLGLVKNLILSLSFHYLFQLSFSFL